MFDLIANLVQINFIPLCSLIFLYIFLRINDTYEHDISMLFYPVIILVLCLIIDDNLDYYMMDRAQAGIAHTAVTMAGYNLRILILVSLMRITMRDREIYVTGVWKDWRKIIFVLPAVITFLITCLSFFTHLVFWYDPDGSFMRGPLTYIPHIVSFIYSIELIAYAVYIRIIHRRMRESLILILTTLFSIVGTFAEMVFLVRGILIGFISLSITFYYLCIHLEYFKYDILTGVLNRTSFYADISKAGASGSGAVMSLDLNDLKLINDNEGHLAGDEALKTVAKTIARCLTHNCVLYRIGGDEFAVIARKVTEDDMKNLIKRIDDEMSRTRYKVAAGYSMWDSSESFNEVFDKADMEMYKNKKFLKGISIGSK